MYIITSRKRFFDLFKMVKVDQVYLEITDGNKFHQGTIVIITTWNMGYSDRGNLPPRETGSDDYPGRVVMI